MPDIRRYKIFLYFVTVFVLLSFFAVQPTAVDFEVHRMGAAAVLCTPGGVQTEDFNMILPARHLLEDIAEREKASTHILLLRFLMVTFAVFLLFCALYRMMIRRFGGHMIALWQNIHYIHQIDGEKDSAFCRYIMS